MFGCNIPVALLEALFLSYSTMPVHAIHVALYVLSLRISFRYMHSYSQRKKKERQRHTYTIFRQNTGPYNLPFTF